MNVRMAAAVDGWLATHAGLTSQFADIVLEIDDEAEPFRQAIVFRRVACRPAQRCI